MPRAASRLLTPEQFDAAAARVRMGEDRLAGARLAMVTEESLQGVGDLYGHTRQWVSDAVSIIWRAHQEIEDEKKRALKGSAEVLPRGWVAVSLAMPKALEPLVREFIAQHVNQAGAPAAKKKARSG
ncbi:hypothetical protein ACVNIS_24965 (plasmid) [Sphaerotilaceae bacterium SBD11-9]